MRAMLWLTERGRLPKSCTVSGEERLGALGSNWPDYGFDEWFLKVAVYPRIVLFGVLTFIS